jgi:hypothetical protein
MDYHARCSASSAPTTRTSRCAAWWSSHHIGSPLIAAGHGDRSRKDVLELTRRWLLR